SLAREPLQELGPRELFEDAELPLAEERLLDRPLELERFGDDRGRLAGPREVARADRREADCRELLGERPRLVAPRLVQGDVGVTLDLSEGIPVRLSVTRQINEEHGARA